MMNFIVSSCFLFRQTINDFRYTIGIFKIIDELHSSIVLFNKKIHDFRYTAGCSSKKQFVLYISENVPPKLLVCNDNLRRECGFYILSRIFTQVLLEIYLPYCTGPALAKDVTQRRKLKKDAKLK